MFPSDLNLSTQDIMLFSNNIKEKLQAKSKLAALFPTQALANASLTQVTTLIGPTEVYERNTVGQPTIISASTYEPRWIKPTFLTSTNLVDELDLLQTMIDPTSSLVESIGSGFGRKKDALVVEALVGTAITGIKGTSSTSFNSNNIIPFDGNNSATGYDQELTPEKLRTARSLMSQNNVDPDATLYCICDSQGYNSLMKSVTTTNSLYIGSTPLVTGELPQFYGIKIVCLSGDGSGGSGGVALPTRIGNTELKDGVVNSNGIIRNAIITTSDAIVQGVTKDVSFVINNRPDLNNAKQIQGTYMGGAARIYENKVVQVEYAII